jgi:hypothetical protein
MGGRIPLFAAVLGAVLSVGLSAMEVDPEAEELTPTQFAAHNSKAESRETVEPWIHPSMPGGMREKVEVAFRIAVQRLRKNPGCRALFSELGADGVELLAATRYYPAPLFRQTTRCRHSFAITWTGSPVAWVCRKVTAHGDERVAVALLHEALHFAGLDEDPNGLTAQCSGEINVMVMEHCGF